MKTVRLFFLFIIILNSGMIGKKESVEKSKVKIVECSYGLCQSKILRTTKSDSSPGGRQLVLDNFGLIKQTDTIEAIIGAEFGVQYYIKTHGKSAVPIRISWTFPETMINAKTGEKFTHVNYFASYIPGNKVFSVYKLEEKYELLKGNWAFQLYSGEDLLYTRIFHLE